jgi:hypothetical protein
MHFRVFIPSDSPRPSASKEPLIEAGLGHLAENFIGTIVQPGQLRSVGPKGGNVYHWPQPGDMSFLAEGLQWTPAKEFRGLAAGRYHVGLNPDKPPLPRELAVPLQVTGDHLWLGEASRTWVIPNVMFLPTKVVLTVDGVKHERLARFQARNIEAASWIKECKAFTEQLRKEQYDDSCDWERAWNFGYDSLAINYRVTPEVVDALNLLTSDRLGAIILASIGAYEMERRERLEKQAADQLIPVAD